MLAKPLAGQFSHPNSFLSQPPHYRSGTVTPSISMTLIRSAISPVLNCRHAHPYRLLMFKDRHCPPVTR